MPEKLTGKLIIANTVTKQDEELLKERGVKTLVTTTPEIGGRSLGTNVLEAILVTLLGKKPEEITPYDYGRILKELDIMPRIKRFSD